GHGAVRLRLTRKDSAENVVAVDVDAVPVEGNAMADVDAAAADGAVLSARRVSDRAAARGHARIEIVAGRVRAAAREKTDDGREDREFRVYLVFHKSLSPCRPLSRPGSAYSCGR